MNQNTGSGTGAGRPDPALVPTPAARAANRVASHRHDTLAALLDGGDEGGGTDAAQEPDETAAQDEAVEVDEGSGADEGADTDQQTEQPDAPAKAAAGKPDAESAKRLAAINDQERRAREKLTKEREDWKTEQAKARAELERERAEWKAKVEAVERFEKLKARAKVDPTAALEELGVDDFEYAAKQAYARSKGAADPANREAAARMIREREAADDLAETRRELKELKDQLAKRDQEVQYREAWQIYLGDVTKAATADTSEAPLLRAQLGKNPARAHAAIRDVATDLFQRTGEWPDAQDVITTYEKRRRDELEELGIDVAAISSTKKQGQAAGKKKPATSLGNDLSHAREPRPPKSGKEHRAETLAMLEADRLE